MSDETPITFDEIKRVRLEPGDALLVKVHDEITPKIAEHIRKQVEEKFPDTTVLVIDANIDLAVVSA